VALIAGGHTFGKTHGAGDAKHVGPEPEAAGIEEQGLGWKSTLVQAKAATQSLVAWKSSGLPLPRSGSTNFFWNLFSFEWELTKSPAGCESVEAERRRGCRDSAGCGGPVKASRAIHADHGPRSAVRPCLRKDFTALHGESGSVCGRVRPGVVQADAPRYGPRARYLGPEVPAEELIWQDPIPAVNHKLIDAQDIDSLRGKILASGLSVSELVSTAWASASTFRGSDKRGGANGARIRLARRKIGKSTSLPQLAKVLKTLEGIQSAFNSVQSGGKKVSLADLIVLAGCAGVEQAARTLLTR